MEKKKKIKVIVPVSQKKEVIKEEEKLEEIVDQNVRFVPRSENISLSLELERPDLETQVGGNNEPANNNTLPVTDQRLYGTVNNQNQGNYQEANYSTVNFAPPPSSLEITRRDDNFRSPMFGFRQSNPFNSESSANPMGINEQNYDSLRPDDDKKRRR